MGTSVDSPTIRPTSRRPAVPVLWGMFALAWTLLALAGAWLPSGIEATTVATGGTAGGSGGTPTASTQRRVSLIETEGASVLAVLAVPVVVAAAPLLARRRPWAQGVRIGSAAALGLGTIAAAASIGVVYLPALAALMVAAVTGARRPPPPPPRTPA